MADNDQMTPQQYEQVWEQDRLQQQEQDRVQNLEYTRQQLAEARVERDQAAAEGDWDMARQRNSDVGMWQQQERDLTPPPQPQLSQSDLNFLARKQAYREQYGAKADETIAMAHVRAVTPRNPNATSASHPFSYGHGQTPGTRGYYQAVQAELEANGRLNDAPYDPSTDMPGWKEIAHRYNQGRNNAEKEQDYLQKHWENSGARGARADGQRSQKISRTRGRHERLSASYASRANAIGRERSSSRRRTECSP